MDDEIKPLLYSRGPFMVAMFLLVFWILFWGLLNVMLAFASGLLHFLTILFVWIDCLVACMW